MLLGSIVMLSNNCKDNKKRVEEIHCVLPYETSISCSCDSFILCLLQTQATLTTNDIVINKLTQILLYLRQGTRGGKKVKKKEKGRCT